MIRVDLDEREQHMDLDDVVRAKAGLPIPPARTRKARPVRAQIFLGDRAEQSDNNARAHS